VIGITISNFGVLYKFFDIVSFYDKYIVFVGLEDMKPDPEPLQGQLEQTLAQQIQALYLNSLGHKPEQISCKLIDRTLFIVVEDPTTPVERFLVASGKQQLAEQVRTSIHIAFQPQLKALIEEVLKVNLIDFLGNSNLYTGRTSITAILPTKP